MTQQFLFMRLRLVQPLRLAVTLTSFLIAFSFFGCDNDDSPEPAFMESGTSTSIFCSAFGDNQLSIKITTNSHPNFSIPTNASDWVWLNGEKSFANGYIYHFTVTPNESVKQRETTLTAECGDQKIDYKLTQYGQYKFSLEQRECTVQSEGGKIVPKYTTNGVITIISEVDWLTVSGDSIIVSPNGNYLKRSSTVAYKTEDGSQILDKLTITQEHAKFFEVKGVKTEVSEWGGVINVLATGNTTPEIEFSDKSLIVTQSGEYAVSDNSLQSSDVSYTIAPNPSFSEREIKIFLRNGDYCYTVDIKQPATKMRLLTERIDKGIVTDVVKISYELNPDLDMTLRWSSSDENVASVDDRGNVTLTGKGNATITAYVIHNGKEEKYGSFPVDAAPITDYVGLGFWLNATIQGGGRRQFVHNRRHIFPH